jgi:hypothetical protein
VGLGPQLSFGLLFSVALYSTDARLPPSVICARSDEFIEALRQEDNQMTKIY